MNDLFLVGSFNNWEIRQQFRFKGHEGNLSTLLVDLPAGTHEFLIATSQEVQRNRLGADGSGTKAVPNQLIYLKEGEAKCSLTLDQSGIYLFSIDSSQDSPTLRILTKYTRSTVEKEVTHSLGLDHFLKMNLPVTFEVGQSDIRITEALSLAQGSVVELDSMVGEPLNVYVGGKLVALGESVVVNNHFGIRILEILSPDEQLLGSLTSTQTTSKGDAV